MCGWEAPRLQISRYTASARIPVRSPGCRIRDSGVPRGKRTGAGHPHPPRCPSPVRVRWNTVRVIIVDTPEEVARTAARRVARAIDRARLVRAVGDRGRAATAHGHADAPTAVLGVATGSSPLGTYRELGRLARAGEVDLSGVAAFALDEYVSLDAAHPESYHAVIRRTVTEELGLDPGLVQVPDGTAADLEAACERYERAIAEAGGVDLQILGIGTNGHIGFNEPDDHFSKGTHCVDLTESTIQANSRLFDSIDDVPRQAYTMGTQTIMYARMILVVANGEAKAQAVHDMCYGPVTPACPASILQLHTNCVVVADEAALSLCE
ncbi:MAG: glucosamine-6-phosphate deaminase [Leucobacter sp.]|nr:glucosamine-6-phosphate deaminase [Leucobacter sp.]